MSAKNDPTANGEEALVTLSKEDLFELRDLYKRDYPHNVLSYNKLVMFLEWIEKNIAVNDFTCQTFDQQWRTHGVFLIRDYIAKAYHLHCDVLGDENHAVLLKALQRLDAKPAILFFAYPKSIQGVINQYMGELGVTDMTDKIYPTVLYFMPKEECLKMEISDMPGYVAKPLTASNVHQVNAVWPHHAPGSEKYVERIITNNLTLGIFEEESGELCAWVLQSELGALALLQVESKYQRRGLAQHVVRVMSKRIAELKDMDVTATVIETNVASRNLFDKLGFRIIRHINWLAKPAVPSNTSDISKSHPDMFTN